MKSNILVLGGKGKTGRRVAERLSKMGHKVRIGSRSETPAFDWDKPETWAKAMEGMDRMYITFQPDLAVPGAFEAIQGLMEEAKQQNIQKV
ncbi:MAG: SDR family oxidoreductase, partial [Allomuricauda sp.]